MGEVFSRRARMTMYVSARVVEDGKEAEVALSRSISFPCKLVRFATKVSFGAARMKTAMRRRLSWVLRSASNRADDAPTPNIMPAEVGEERRVSNSGIRSFSANTSCRSMGSQPVSTKSREHEKNLESLNASVTSRFHSFAASGMLVNAVTKSRKYFETFPGNDFDR